MFEFMNDRKARNIPEEESAVIETSLDDWLSGLDDVIGRRKAICRIRDSRRYMTPPRTYSKTRTNVKLSRHTTSHQQEEKEPLNIQILTPEEEETELEI